MLIRARFASDFPTTAPTSAGERFSAPGGALLVNRYLRRIGITDHSGPRLLRHTWSRIGRRRLGPE